MSRDRRQRGPVVKGFAAGADDVAAEHLEQGSTRRRAQHVTSSSKQAQAEQRQVLGPASSAAEAEGETFSLSLLTWNTSDKTPSESAPPGWGVREQRQGIAQAVLALRPDVVCLQEVMSAEEGGLPQLLGHAYDAHGWARSHRGACVTLVLRGSGVEVTQRGAACSCGPAVVMQLTVTRPGAGGRFCLANCHLAPGASKEAALARFSQLQDVAEGLDELGGPSLIVGDMNMRKEEDKKARGLGLADAWEQAGGDEATRNTWDTKTNRYYKDGWAYTARYDRVYLRQARCSSFRLAGNEPCNPAPDGAGDHFLSDHFGIFTQIELPLLAQPDAPPDAGLRPPVPPARAAAEAALRRHALTNLENSQPQQLGTSATGQESRKRGRSSSPAGMRPEPQLQPAPLAPCGSQDHLHSVGVERQGSRFQSHEAEAGAAAAATQLLTWSCSVCTLDNAWAQEVCECCGSGERPAPAPRRSLQEQRQLKKQKQHSRPAVEVVCLLDSDEDGEEHDTRARAAGTGEEATLALPAVPAHQAPPPQGLSHLNLAAELAQEDSGHPRLLSGTRLGAAGSGAAGAVSGAAAGSGAAGAVSPELPLPQPTSSLQQPTSSLQQPTSSLQQPTSSLQQPTSSLQQPTSSLQHPTSSLQQPTSSLQQPTSSLQHPTSSLQQPTSSLQQPTSSLQQPTSSLASLFMSTLAPQPEPAAVAAPLPSSSMTCGAAPATAAPATAAPATAAVWAPAAVVPSCSDRPAVPRAGPCTAGDNSWPPSRPSLNAQPSSQATACQPPEAVPSTSGGTAAAGPSPTAPGPVPAKRSMRAMAQALSAKYRTPL